MTKATVWAVCLLSVGGLLALDATRAQSRVAKPGANRVQNAIPKAGGADCASATVVTTPLPYMDSGNTCGAPAAVSDYNNQGTGGPCATYLYPGPELIYRMDLGANNDVTVTLAPVAPADLGVFVVGDCQNTLSCVGFQDVAGGGEMSAVTFEMGQSMCSNETPSRCPGIGAGMYWIYVDSFYASGASSCGNYSLSVSGTIPVELMEFSVD